MKLLMIISASLCLSLNAFAQNQNKPLYSRAVALKVGQTQTVRGVLVSCGVQTETKSTAGNCNKYGCSPCGTCTMYGCPKCTSPFFGGSCNEFGCWDGENGECNIMGCTNNGTCNKYGCSDTGVCNQYGCP